MTTHIHKGDDLLSVDESVISLLIKMGAIEYADNSDRDICVEIYPDKIKYDLKITVTKTRSSFRKFLFVNIMNNLNRLIQERS